MGVEDSKYFAQKAADELKQKQERKVKRKAFYDKITSSRKEAIKSLQEAGIYDEKGHLSEIYR